MKISQRMNAGVISGKGSCVPCADINQLMVNTNRKEELTASKTVASSFFMKKWPEIVILKKIKTSNIKNPAFFQIRRTQALFVDYVTRINFYLTIALQRLTQTV